MSRAISTSMPCGPARARGGERGKIGVNADPEPALGTNLIEALADGVDRVGVDPRPGRHGADERREPGQRRAPAQLHGCTATVSSQERIAQIASWLSTPSNGGM